MTMLRAVFLALLLFGAPALAVQPDEILSDPALESRARAISRDLRCLVCQNQSIDDSNAPLARDLRVIVRERLTAGDGDRQVLDFVTARYGDYVLLRTPFKASTYLLWFGPLLLLGLGGIGVALFFSNRRASKIGATAPLSAEENQRLERLLGAEGRQ